MYGGSQLERLGGKNAAISAGLGAYGIPVHPEEPVRLLSGIRIR